MPKRSNYILFCLLLVVFLFISGAYFRNGIITSSKLKEKNRIGDNRLVDASDIYRNFKLSSNIGNSLPLAPVETSTSSTSQSSSAVNIPGSSNDPPQETAAPKASDNINSDFSALRDLCSKTQWTSGLWLHCHSNCGSNETSVCGGLNNARNRIQTCMRYAIDAGAGLIVPSVTTRSESHLSDTGGGDTVCPSFFWDMGHLKSTMQKHCPQLDLRFCDDRSGINKVFQLPQRGYLDGPYHKGAFRDVVGNSLYEHGIDTGGILRKPIVINFADSYLGWSYSQSGELTTVRKDLYKTLQYNRELLDISYRILSYPQLEAGKFIGVHLRGEDDWPANFGSGEVQSRFYKQEIERIHGTDINGIKTVYVSSGDAGVIQTFRETLTPLGFTVHDKWSLLSDDQELLVKIDGLPFDQKGIIEYETLTYSKYFLGPAMSSMSSLIAYQRTIAQHEDFFTTHIFPGSVKNEETRVRIYADSPALLGDETTKLVVVNEVDIMDNFP